MALLASVFRAFASPVRQKAYCLFLILNTVSSLSIFGKGCSGFLVVLAILSIAAAVAYIEALATIPLRGRARAFAVVAICVVHNIFIAADYYCRVMFGKTVSQDVIDILAETNPTEIENFAATYFSFGTILTAFAAIALFNLAAIFIARLVRRLRFMPVCLALSVCGFLVWAFMLYSFVAFRNGMSIPQYHAFTRTGYAIFIVRQNMKKVENLRLVAQRLECRQTGKRHTFVVVIGESHSVFHSSLYGYEKENEPNLLRLKRSGELTLFADAVSAHDHTHSTMQSVFSLDRLTTDFARQPLFPMCFKKAGYHTELWDNQYSLGGVNFLSDPELSALMFDRRNTRMYAIDGEMIDEISPTDTPSLIVVHLWGQHYEYEQRYPANFARFRPSDYPGRAHAERLAAYDNATLYNDHVLARLVNKFRDRDACIIYISDHGEEVYDIDDYAGHGNAHTRDPKYQLRVPMFIIATEKFRQSAPALIDRIRRSADIPVATDDLPHLLLDMAGIATAAYDSTRSAIHPSYIRRHRTVLNSIDFDE